MHMKLNKQIIVPSLALLIGASLAGSISSTVAWYQYAVKAQAAYVGTTSHCSKLLSISADNGSSWHNSIGSSAFQEVSFAPITTGEQAKNEALSQFYAQPNFRQGLYANWFSASATTYAQYTILVKVNDVNTGSPQLANDVYLTDLVIEDADEDLDLSKAVRVHIATTWGNNNHKYFLFAKSVTSTDVGGYLDINNDHKIDTYGYEWGEENVLYGGGTVEAGVLTPLKQTSYLCNDPNVIATQNSKGEITEDTNTKAIGQTSATANDYLRVDVTIWLEGWALLKQPETNNIDSTDNARVWKSDTYTSQDFHVGLEFGVKLHSSNE